MIPQQVNSIIRFVTQGNCNTIEQMDYIYPKHVIRKVQKFLNKNKENNEPKILK
jgi:hypothetical protein